MVTAVLHYRQARFLNAGAAALARAHLRRQVKDPELRRRLTPDYSFGCKRPTFSNDYYPAFNEEHVHLETTPIDQITPGGIVTTDGRETEVDVLVLATGFNLWDTNFPAIEVIGRDGLDLGKSWREHGYHAYEGVSVPGFPNFLTLNSPYSYSGLSYFMTIEVQMRHLERLFGELRRRRATTFEIRERGRRGLPRADARADGRHGVHPGLLRHRPQLLLHPRGRCGAAAPDLLGTSAAGRGAVPPRRLLLPLTTPSSWAPLPVELGPPTRRVELRRTPNPEPRRVGAPVVPVTAARTRQVKPNGQEDPTRQSGRQNSTVREGQLDVSR